MATPPLPHDHAGFSDSDQQWFDRLSGRPGPFTDAQAVREADAMKLATTLELEADEADLHADAAAVQRQQARWVKLQARRAREGLGAHAAGAAPAQPWWREVARSMQTRWRWRAAAGLAGALVLGVTLVLQRPDLADYPSPAVMYGEIDTQQVQADNPRQAADALAAALRQAGLKAAQYQRGKTYLVDINLQPDEQPVAEAALKTIGLTPRPGQTRIEISPR